MIFVTVGTHDQQFNRLVKCVDELKGKGIIEDELIIQNGYSDYKILNCEHRQFYSFSEIMELYEKARIIVTHGGPSSFIQALQIGKIPIVVPRQKKYGEHVNCHQLEFGRAVSERYNNIILIEDTDDLKDAILNYDERAASKKLSNFGNTAGFNEKFEKIVEEL